MKRVIVLLGALLLAVLTGWTALSGLGGVSVAEAQTSSTEELSGVLNVRWIDPPQDSDREPGVELVLTDSQGRKTDLELGGEALRRAGGAVALNGKRVTVEGRGTAGEEFDAQSIEPTQNARDVEVQRTVSGQKPTVTILCRFADSTGVTPHAKGWFETLMGGTNPGLGHYWQEISYSKINLAGSTVVGWYNLPKPKSHYQVSGGYDEDLLARHCTQAADANVIFPDYTNINLMFNGTPDTYALGGTNTLNLDGQTKTYGMIWIPRFAYEPGSGPNGTGQVWIAHEMGHSFGLPHSSGPYGETYDSDWDPMSDGSVCSPSDARYGCVGVYTTTYHMDGLLGWIPPTRKYTATSGSDQNITLERLGAPGANGAYLMARVPIPGSTTRFYTVEVRRFTGYDGQVPGEAVVIHKVDTTLSDRNAKVVDSDNDGDPNDAGAMWVPGETFTEPANGIKVKVTGATASGYDVTINPSDSGGGDPAAPRIQSSTPFPDQRGVGLRPTVKTTFDKEMDRGTLTAANVELYRSGATNPVDATVTLGSDGWSITLEPTNRLKAGKWYYVLLWRDSNGVKDLANNPLSGGGDYLVDEYDNYVYWWFKTRA
jgi:M6 family metalloprotease-like protein